MATTIQSGRASSPLLTADVASRAEVYGGRGLVFDGASDYLDCGTGLGNKLGDNYSKDSGLTISLWFKADETNVTRGLLSISSFSDSFGQLFIRLASNELQFKLNNNWTRSVAFTDLGWNHIAVVYADTKENSKMYLNGTAVGSESGSFPSSLNLNGLKTVIGGFYSSSFTFNGSMADVKIHSSALTEAEITSQYLKPESVPSPSSLVAWYPMCESNPENPQSIVYDHSEKKLGSELITASLDTGSGITSSSYITYDGKMNINGSGQDFYITINNTADTSSTSFRYRLVVTVDSYTSGGMSMAGGSAGFNAFTIGDSFNDIIVPDSNGGSFQFRVVNYVGVISSMSLKKIEMGNHATTNFFGDDLTNGHGAFDVTTNWSVVSGSLGTEWSIGSSKATHATGNTNTLRYTDSSNPMVNGTLYQVDFTISGRTAGHVNFAIGGASSSTDNFTASNSTQRSSGGSVSRVVDIKPSTDFDGAVELISIKEVGISSSGFTTAQNEPVIPQIPLVKSNEKMLFNGIDNQVEVTNPFNFGASTDFSISFWLLATDVTQSDTFIVRKKSGTEGIRIFLTGSDNVFFNFFDGSTEKNVISASNSLTDNTLHHCCIFVDRNGNAQWYINGVVSGSAVNVSSVGNIDNTANLFMGSQGGSAYFDGFLDDLAVFNTALSSTEIQELFNDGVALDATTHSKSGNLLGYWRNDGVTQWIDRSTNSNHGTVAGSPDSITIREGLNSNKDGLGFPLTNSSSNVVRLNGSSEYVNLGVVNTDIWKSSFTISFWVKPSDGQPSAGLQVMGVDDATGDDSRIFISHTTAGKFYLRYEAEGTIKDLTMNSAIYDDGQVGWKHLTFVIDVNNDNGYIYVNDGVIASNGNGLYSGVDTSGTSIENDFYIGAENRSGSSYFKGLIDEVRIYNKALSATEISKNYKHQKGKHKND